MGPEKAFRELVSQIRKVVVLMMGQERLLLILDFHTSSVAISTSDTKLALYEMLTRAGLRFRVENATYLLISESRRRRGRASEELLRRC